MLCYLFTPVAAILKSSCWPPSSVRHRWVVVEWECKSKLIPHGWWILVCPSLRTCVCNSNLHLSFCERLRGWRLFGKWPSTFSVTSLLQTLLQVGVAAICYMQCPWHSGCRRSIAVVLTPDLRLTRGSEVRLIAAYFKLIMLQGLVQSFTDPHISQVFVSVQFAHLNNNNYFNFPPDHDSDCGSTDCYVYVIHIYVAVFGMLNAYYCTVKTVWQN